MRLYVPVQQELDVERFRTKLTLELFGMTSQMLFHIGLRVERSVTHQTSQHLEDETEIENCICAVVLAYAL